MSGDEYWILHGFAASPIDALLEYTLQMRHAPSPIGGLPMRRTLDSKIVFTVAVLLSTLVVVACDGRSSASVNPVGPSVMAGHAGSSGNMASMTTMGSGSAMGNMPGRGMGMEVASEFDYLIEMIPHHDEAIAAARVLQRGTQRQEMRNFAVSIIETQTAEVEEMKTWLAAWYPGRDTHVNYEAMMRDLTGLSGNALDRAFLEDMIPHHMMAVMMSQQFLAARLADHAEVAPFAANIRNTQQTEIHTMAAWLRDWFGRTPGMGHGGH